jgi:hypothetical protein
MMPSTAQIDKDVPIRPYFSHNTATTTDIRNKIGALASSPLFKMSTNTESGLLDDDIAKKRQPSFSKLLSNDYI